MSQITEPRDTGGPAFPTTDPNYEQRYAGEGMTLRDYFAAKAPKETIKFDSPKAAADFAGVEVPTTTDDLVRVAMACAAKAAFMYADAMLAERAKP